jgi:hypothetical protein
MDNEKVTRLYTKILFFFYLFRQLTDQLIDNQMNNNNILLADFFTKQ